MMRRNTALFVITAMIGLSGCASRSEKVMALASKGFSYDAVYQPSVGGNPNALRFLEQRAAWLDVTIAYLPKAEIASAGRTQGRHIFVDADLSVAGRLEVLAHELGHVFSPQFSTPAEGDVFAELVSVEICKRLGHDTTKVAAGYLTVYKMAFDVGKRYQPEIQMVAELLTKGYR